MTRRDSTYDQRGGDGPTCDRVAATYEVILPDGRVVRKRTFGVSGPTAVAVAHFLAPQPYKTEGTQGWHLTAITASRPTWAEPDATILPARRMPEVAARGSRPESAPRPHRRKRHA